MIFRTAWLPEIAVSTLQLKLGMLLTLFLCSLSISAGAQDTDVPANSSADEGAAVAETGDDSRQDDPFAVPEGASAEELFEFILRVKKQPSRTRQAVIMSAAAVVDAAQAIRKIVDVGIQDEIRAIEEQLAALTFLSRQDAQRNKQLQDLIDELNKDDRAEIAKLGATEALKVRISNVFRADPNEKLEVIADYKTLIAESQFDRTAYAMGMGLARGLEDPNSPDTAAEFYEFLAVQMEQSNDPVLQDRSESTLGAARRVRLPGRFMQLEGTTTDGETFDWDSYRGKIVLVDFWASWCGPCRAEIPNMKRNLEAYADRGFAIVGINLDDTHEACNRYVEQEEIGWPNLVGQEGESNPMVTFYGISAIPTAILVDREGNVVSLRARGNELDRLLAEMLGEPKADEAEPAEAPDPDDA